MTEKKDILSMEQIDFDAQLGVSIFELYDEDGKTIHTGSYDNCIIWAHDNEKTIGGIHD
jgi:hypothetical protein